MNKQLFKIYGEERRRLKKELREIKSFVKHFWYNHRLEKDMAYLYGSTEDYPMSDEKAKAIYDKNVAKIEEIAIKLTEPYEN